MTTIPITNDKKKTGRKLRFMRKKGKNFDTKSNTKKKWKQIIKMRNTKNDSDKNVIISFSITPKRVVMIKM